MNPQGYFIKRKAAASLLHSPRTAAAIGRPFNTYVTIDLWQLGISPKAAYHHFQQLRDRHFQRWSRYRQTGQGSSRNGPPTYTWVIEAPRELAHVHWMLHIVPNMQLEFRKRLPKWLKKRLQRNELPEGVVEVKDVHNPEGLKLYFAKGIDPALGRQWNILPAPSGLVFGRRAGTSRNLGPAEWQPRKAAWKRLRSRVA